MNAKKSFEAEEVSGDCTAPRGAVRYARFASLKGQLTLESKGLKCRGGALRPRLAQEFGLKPRDPHSAYIAYCESQMAILIAKK